MLINFLSRAFHVITIKLEFCNGSNIINLIFKVMCPRAEEWHLQTCRKCGSFIDTDFKFCKTCGCFRYFKAKSFNTDDTCIDNLETVGAINNRIMNCMLRYSCECSNYTVSWMYQIMVNKMSVKTEFTNFLKKRHPSKHLYNASPEDIRALSNNFGSKISWQYFRQNKGNS